jgi:tetratricopeptide (TPR) repeat protein
MDSPSHLVFLEKKLSEVSQKAAAAPPQAGLLLEKARLLTHLGRPTEAKAAYLELLNAFPDHPEALQHFGEDLQLWGYRKAAALILGRLSVLQPQRAEAWAQLGRTLLEMDSPLEARTAFERALALDPNASVAHQGLAALDAAQRNLGAALEHARKAYSGKAPLRSVYHGEKPPIPVLVLSSALGGNIPLRWSLDHAVFQATYVAVEFQAPGTAPPKGTPIFNAVGDADLCAEALRSVESWCQKFKLHPLNPPQTVARTRRSDNAERLKDLPGLKVPLAVDLERRALEAPDAEARLLERGFRFPLMVRARGYQAGQHFVRVETPEALTPALAELPGDAFTVLEFLETKGADGRRRKYRVLFIGGRLFPLHAAVSAQRWKIHYFSADMAEDAANRAEDAAFLDDMPGVLGPRVLGVLQAIEARLGLDYGGIDFGIAPDGDVVFFEANATMTLLPPPPGEAWDYRKEAAFKARAALSELLRAKAVGA